MNDESHNVVQISHQKVDLTPNFFSALQQTDGKLPRVLKRQKFKKKSTISSVANKYMPKTQQTKNQSRQLMHYEKTSIFYHLKKPFSLLLYTLSTRFTSKPITLHKKKPSNLSTQMQETRLMHQPNLVFLYCTCTQKHTLDSIFNLSNKCKVRENKSYPFASETKRTHIRKQLVNKITKQRS